MTKFLSNISLETATDIQFKTTAGANAGKIEQDGNDLVLTNAVGDILLGDGASDVYIGDGTNNVDIIFEQSGSIKGDGSSVTLTLGGSGTTLNLENPNVNGSVSLGVTGISNVLTLTSSSSKIVFDYEAAQTGEYTNEVPLLQVDRSGSPITILSRVSSSGAVVLGADDMVHIAAGDTKAVVKSNRNMAEEQVVFSSEAGFIAYGFPDNGVTWSNRNEFKFRSDSATASQNGLYIGDGGNTQFIDLSRNLTVGTISSGVITTTGFVLDGNTITGVDDSGEFTDNDAHIMTSAAVNDRIQASIVANTDTQDLSISGQTLSLTNGGSVTLPDTNTQLSTEAVQDIVGAMVQSNSEDGISVAYQDGDGTLDFTVGTLNQNTTGSAATLTTARTIGGVSFNGSANINLAGVNTTGNQNTSGSSASCTGNAATATKISSITNSNIVQLAASQTLTNKTIAASQVTEISNITASEGAQIENIGSTTISATQWGYLGAASGAITNTDVSVSSANLKTVLGDGFPSNTVTIGDSNDVVTFANDVTVSGDLTVTGDTITVNTSSLTVKDPLIVIANNNAADAIDTGFYSQYVANIAGTNSTRYAGVFRDASADGDPFSFFDTLTDEPTTTVNTAHSSFDYAPIKAGAIQAVDGFVGNLTGAVTGNASTATKISSITNSNIVQLAASQTLTNKTIAASQITEISNITASEGAQLENIGSTTISATQWGYLGAATGAITNTDTQLSLSNSISSTSTTVAASSSAAKSAYDRGSTGVTNAASAQTTANAALPKAGGTMTGDLTTTKIHLGNVDLYPSGDNNHLHFLGTAMIGGSTTASNNPRIGTSTYPFHQMHADSFHGTTITASGEVEGGSLDINGNADISGNITSANWTGDVIGSAYLDSDTMHLSVSQNISAIKEFQDSVQLRFGNDADLRMQHTGSHGYIDSYTGDFYIRNTVADKHIYIKADDGAGSNTTYIDVDGNNQRVQISKPLVLSSGVAVSSILDEDAMGSNSATALATQQSIKAYVTASVSAEGGGDVTLSGTQTFTGAKTFTNTLAFTGTGRITGIDTVSAGTDAANKTYVDNAVIANTDTQDLSISGQTLSLTNGGSVTIPTQTSVSGSAGTVTSIGNLTGDVTSSNRATTIASAAVHHAMLHDDIISGQGALTSGLADTDEFMISDAGTVKRMDASVLKTYMQNGLTFTTNTNTQLSTEAVQDIVGAMLVGTETRIGVSYDDTNGRINFVVDDMTANTNTQLSNAEVRAATAAATDSQVFTDADHTKLDGIETGATADQTSVSGSSGSCTGNAATATKISSITNSNIVQLSTTTTQTGTKTFSGVIDITNTTDSTNATGDTGALRTEGGASIAKKLYVGSTITGSADVIAYSDERLKKNVKTLDGKKVLEMRGVSFERVDSGKQSSGVIAQEMEKVAPELVIDDGNYKGVAYGNVVGYLIEAIKDQQKQIDELKKLCNGCSK